MDTNQDFDSDTRNLICKGSVASIMAVKHEIDLIVSDITNGLTSVINYRNDGISNTEDRG